MATGKALKQLADAMLDMSNSARIGRAKEMGMRTGMPLYHGTNQDISQFSLERGGEVSRSPVGKLGVSLATDPDTASEFANLAGSEGANVIQAYHRASKPVRIQLEGGETNLEVAATVQEAWDQGFDAIKFDNYTTPGGEKGRSFVLVKDPSQIRSVNAAFDPAKKESANLLASALPGALGIGALSGGEKASAEDLRQLELAEAMMAGEQPAMPGDVGGIQAIHGSPKMLELAEALRGYSNTPIGPMLGGTADLIEKMGWGRKPTYWDSVGAGLDFF